MRLNLSKYFLVKTPISYSKIELQIITIDTPKTCVSIIDKFCNISFIPRREWLLDAINKKLKRYITIRKIITKNI
jgi:hypothetical protein